ncbi:hypothetical protein [Ferruginivarius sediminum]|uniref:Uncharacterized protein n=1 Tax=Ferruginivarius sediminum TaxID=2661937 RepID=A0A369TBA8_9PROT|nr:hypothetical protein [Ferruginivarius sediminum]RDD62621.1 hypothetical protein DRB17_05520 [Ferruginivarius sediminum]
MHDDVKDLAKHLEQMWSGCAEVRNEWQKSFLQQYPQYSWEQCDLVLFMAGLFGIVEEEGRAEGVRFLRETANALELADVMTTRNKLPGPVRQ